jgi:hypothetical protein
LEEARCSGEKAESGCEGKVEGESSGDHQSLVFLSLLSLSPLSLSLSLSSQAHTNLDDPASIALAELGHDPKLLCTADARRKKEERKKEREKRKEKKRESDSIPGTLLTF